MSIKSKVGVLAASVLPAVGAFAEGESNPIDLTAASTAVGQMKTSITAFLTGDLLTALLAVIGAGVVIWGVFLAWKFIKRGGQKAG